MKEQQPANLKGAGIFHFRILDRKGVSKWDVQEDKEHATETKHHFHRFPRILSLTALILKSPVTLQTMMIWKPWPVQKQPTNVPGTENNPLNKAKSRIFILLFALFKGGGGNVHHK